MQVLRPLWSDDTPCCRCFWGFLWHSNAKQLSLEASTWEKHDANDRAACSIPQRNREATAWTAVQHTKRASEVTSRVPRDAEVQPELLTEDMHHVPVTRHTQQRLESDAEDGVVEVIAASDEDRSKEKLLMICRCGIFSHRL